MTVYVLGDGKLGLLVAQALALTGCACLLIGRHRAKLELARGWGLDAFLLAARLAGAGASPRLMWWWIAPGARMVCSLPLASCGPEARWFSKAHFMAKAPRIRPTSSCRSGRWSDRAAGRSSLRCNSCGAA